MARACWRPPAAAAPRRACAAALGSRRVPGRAVPPCRRARLPRPSPAPHARPPTTAKREGDQLFECFDAQDLNQRLKDLMPGLSVKVGLVGGAGRGLGAGGALHWVVLLPPPPPPPPPRRLRGRARRPAPPAASHLPSYTARLPQVFRTYNASITLDTLLADDSPEPTVEGKKAEYDRANKEASRAAPPMHLLAAPSGLGLLRGAVGVGGKQAECERADEEAGGWLAHRLPGCRGLALPPRAACRRCRPLRATRLASRRPPHPHPQPLQVAILCNHQRSVPKAHDNQMEKMREKLAALQAEIQVGAGPGLLRRRGQPQPAGSRLVATRVPRARLPPARRASGASQRLFSPHARRRSWRAALQRAPACLLAVQHPAHARLLAHPPRRRRSWRAT